MYRLGDYYSELIQHELNEIKDSEEKYYIEFHDETKKEVNPFKMPTSFSNM